MRVHLFYYDLVDWPISPKTRTQQNPEEQPFDVFKDQCAHKGQPNDHQDQDQAQDDEGSVEVLVEEAQGDTVVCQDADENKDEGDAHLVCRNSHVFEPLDLDSKSFVFSSVKVEGTAEIL